MRSLLLLAACVASDAFFSMGGFSLRGSDAEGQPVEEQNEIVEDEHGVLDSLGFVHLGFLEHRLLSGLTKPQTHNQMLAAGLRAKFDVVLFIPRERRSTPPCGRGARRTTPRGRRMASWR